MSTSQVKDKSQLQKTEDGTITLTVTIPQATIKKAWEEEVEKTVKNATLPGFRQGKAPRKLIEEKIDKDKIREDVLKKLLPQAYIAAVTEHNLKPIMNPKIHVQKLDESADWQFNAITCELPKIDLKNYKEEVKKVTAKSKIILPGKEKQEVKLDDILEVVLKTVHIRIPQVLVDSETEKLLAQLLDEVKRLGLSLDQYLGSTGKTAEHLKKEYQTKATNQLTLEFALQQIADAEHIAVDPKEIDEAILKAKDETERKNLEANRYLLTGILRQQKTLDFLKNL